MADLPVCPLLSAGSDIDMICLKEHCAWYLTDCQTCSVPMFAMKFVNKTKEE